MDQLWQAIRDGGSTAVLAIIVLGAYRGWWVPGPWHKQTVDKLEADVTRANERANRAELIALKASGASEALLDVVRKEGAR